MGYMSYMRHSGRAEKLRRVRKLLRIVVDEASRCGLSPRSVTLQLVGQASRLPDRASGPRWCDRGRDARPTT